MKSKSSTQKTFRLVLLMILILILTSGCASQTQNSQENNIPDILKSVATIFTTICVTGVGTYIGYIYRKRELEIARAEAIRKFFDTLLGSKNQPGDESQIQAALFTISTLGEPKFAIQLAELLATQKEGAIYALNRFEANTDPKISELAEAALKNILDKPHFWENKTGKVLSKARAYKLIDDIAKGKRKYSSAEIHDTFEAACKDDEKAGNELGECLNMYRMSAIYRLLAFGERTPIYRLAFFQRERQIRREFERMIPMFKAIVDVNKNNPDLYKDHAHLAYVYKDSLSPKWELAYDSIKDGIHALTNVPKTHWVFHQTPRNLQDEKYQRTLAGYRFNELLCHVNINKNNPEALREALFKQEIVDLGKNIKNMLKEEMLTTHWILKPGITASKETIKLLEDWVETCPQTNQPITQSAL